MAEEFLFEICQYDSRVRPFQLDDPVSGGHGSPINLQVGNIANRTLYLKHQLDNIPKFLRYTIGHEKDACGSVTDELEHLARTKELLKRALQNCNLPITDLTPFGDYPKYLRWLLTGVSLNSELEVSPAVINTGGYLSLRASIDIPFNYSLEEVPI